jgi:small subunit ribosomal protein S6
MMRGYEYLFIFDPQEENTKKAIQNVRERYANMGVNLMKEEEMGKRRLAYEIKKKTDGFYYVTRIEVDDLTKLQEFERDLTLDQNVIRFMRVRI